MFLLFYGGPTNLASILIFPGHCPLAEMLLQCCGSSSPCVPAKAVSLTSGKGCGPAASIVPCVAGLQPKAPGPASTFLRGSAAVEAQLGLNWGPVHSSAEQGCTPPPYTTPWASLLISPITRAHGRGLDNTKPIFPLQEKELEWIFNSLTECLGLSKSNIFPRNVWANSF